MTTISVFLIHTKVKNVDACPKIVEELLVEKLKELP